MHDAESTSSDPDPFKLVEPLARDQVSRDHADYPVVYPSFQLHAWNVMSRSLWTIWALVIPLSCTASPEVGSLM